MQKVTNGDIIVAQSVFPKVMAQPWPVKIAFQLVKLGAELNKQAQPIHETRNAIITKHGTPDEQGRARVTSGDPGWEGFVKEWTELLEQAVDFPLDPVVLPDVAASITPEVLVALEKFVRFEEKK